MESVRSDPSAKVEGDVHDSYTRLAVSVFHFQHYSYLYDNPIIKAWLRYPSLVTLLGNPQAHQYHLDLIPLVKGVGVPHREVDFGRV